MMKVEEAFEIVYALAQGNVLTDRQVEGNPVLQAQADKQKEALDVVHDFLLNVVYR